MSISEAVLFITSNSRACIPCINFIRHTGLPIDIVRLDTEELRRAAMMGKFFQVTMVPTLVVSYVDDNIQMFVGSPKIMQWLSMITKPEPAHEHEDMEEDRIRERRPPPPVEEDRIRERRPPPVEEDEPDTVVIEEAPSKKRGGKKKKKPPVKFDDDTPPIEEIIDEEPAPKSKKRSSTESGSRMSDIYTMAKQLESERKSSLGYREEDLPKF